MGSVIASGHLWNSDSGVLSAVARSEAASVFAVSHAMRRGSKTKVSKTKVSKTSVSRTPFKTKVSKTRVSKTRVSKTGVKHSYRESGDSFFGS